MHQPGDASLSHKTHRSAVSVLSQRRGHQVPASVPRKSPVAAPLGDRSGRRSAAPRAGRSAGSELYCRGARRPPVRQPAEPRVPPGLSIKSPNYRAARPAAIPGQREGELPQALARAAAAGGLKMRRCSAGRGSGPAAGAASERRPLRARLCRPRGSTRSCGPGGERCELSSSRVPRLPAAPGRSARRPSQLGGRRAAGD